MAGRAAAATVSRAQPRRVARQTPRRGPRCSVAALRSPARRLPGVPRALDRRRPLSPGRPAATADGVPSVRGQHRGRSAGGCGRSCVHAPLQAQPAPPTRRGSAGAAGPPAAAPPCPAPARRAPRAPARAASQPRRLRPSAPPPSPPRSPRRASPRSLTAAACCRPSSGAPHPPPTRSASCRTCSWIPPGRGALGGTARSWQRSPRLSRQGWEPPA